jgi:ABC-2 type transport system permease protein
LVVGFIAVPGCLIVGRFILPSAGINPDHGYALVSLNNSPTLRAAAGSVLYLILIGLLSIGVATAIRDTAASVGAVLGLIYLPPIAAQLVNDPTWRRHLEQIAPMTAGLAIQATDNLRSQPIAPWAGIGVLAAWAVLALLTAGLFLLKRDA